MIISFLLGGAVVSLLSLRSEQNELLGLVGCEQTIEWFNVPFSTTFLKHKFGGSAKQIFKYIAHSCFTRILCHFHRVNIRLNQTPDTTPDQRSDKLYDDSVKIKRTEMDPFR